MKSDFLSQLGPSPAGKMAPVSVRLCACKIASRWCEMVKDKSLYDRMTDEFIRRVVAITYLETFGAKDTPIIDGIAKQIEGEMLNG